MIRRLLFGLFLGLSGPALARAEGFPALFSVQDVAADDVLNIRAEPDAAANILGTLAPDAAGIEITALSDDGNWGLISTGEASGWVAMRFMATDPGQDGPLMMRALACFGTEPFWSLTTTDTAAFSFEEMGAAPETGTMALARSVNRTDKEGFIAQLKGDLLMTGVLTREMCGDGMSDRSYGLTLDLLINGPTGDALFSGCCHLN